MTALHATLVSPADQRGIASARRLFDAAERADGTSPVSDQAMLGTTQGRRELFLFSTGTDSGGADGDDPVAAAILGEGELDLAVRPEARRRGIGRAALDHLLDRVDRGDVHELRSWAHGENPAAHALLEPAGFEPIRTLYRLALDPALLETALAGSRPLPAGFRAVTFDPGDPAHAASWVRVNSAAFATHPEQGSITLEDFAALTAEPWFDPDDLVLAFDESTGELAGSTWVKTVRTPAEPGAAAETETELYALGVDPAYAGRGLGAALLGETLRRMRQHDPQRITLYVDGTNTRARELYHRAGFEVDAVSTQRLRTRP